MEQVPPYVWPTRPIVNTPGWSRRQRERVLGAQQAENTSISRQHDAHFSRRWKNPKFQQLQMHIEL